MRLSSRLKGSVIQGEDERDPMESKLDGLDGMEVLERTLRHFGVSGGTRFSCLRRVGRVLCALPSDTETALRTLALYQPQRQRAKWLKRLLSCGVRLGWHPWLMPSWTLPGNGNRAETVPGVLIGSSGHLCERSVIVTKGESGWEVVKVAFGEKGAEILRGEAEMLKALSKEFTFAPRIIGFEEGVGAGTLRMEWQEGAVWNSEKLTPLFELLALLQGDRPARRLDSFEEWSWIQSGLEGFPKMRARLAEMVDLRVQSVIRHGDLTRPNLRLGTDERLRVHDWERGTMDGLSGVDLVHFLVQDLVFRTRLTVPEVIARVREQLSESAAMERMEKAGWGGLEDEAMAATFALNTAAYRLDQRQFLQCIENSRGN